MKKMFTIIKVDNLDKKCTLHVLQSDQLYSMRAIPIKVYTF